jgi:hypothetical protein
MSTQPPVPPPPSPPQSGTWPVARVIGTTAAALVLAYTVFLVAVGLPKDQRLDTAEVALLLLAGLLATVVWRPDLMDRIKHVKFMGNEIELLEKIHESSEKQKADLEEMRLIISLLLFQTEIAHLRNLAQQKPQVYEGNEAVRRELRRLRTLGLIETLPHRGIGELADGKRIDVTELVRLTKRGKRYLPKLDELLQDAD